jgi:hypothetical protein
MVREPDRPYRRAVKSCERRHFFAYYGWVGSSSPVCRRCGHPNPKYRPELDPFHEDPEIAFWARHRIRRR